MTRFFPRNNRPGLDNKVMGSWNLAYINGIEKFNCVHCEHVNGLIGYVQEIAGRTEHYWCPTKHAMRPKTKHSGYSHFLYMGTARHVANSLSRSGAIIRM